MAAIVIPDEKLCETARYMGQHSTNTETVCKALEFYLRHLQQRSDVRKHNINTADYELLMNELSYAESGRSFTREELNEEKPMIKNPFINNWDGSLQRSEIQLF